MQFPSGNSPQVPQAQRAVVSPAMQAPNSGLINSFKFSAGGGLLAGVVAGFVLITGASEPTKEVNATVKIEAKKVALLGDDTGPELVEADVGEAESEAAPAVGEDVEKPSDTKVDPADLVAATPETPADTQTDTAETAATPTAPEPTESLTNYSVMFQIRPAILRDTISIKVDGEPYDIQSFYSLGLKTGQKSQKIQVTAIAEGYRDFKGSQVIRRDDQFIIQMKEKPKTVAPAVVAKVSTPKTTKPKSTKPKVRKPKVKKPKTTKPRKPRKPKGPGSLISL